MGAAQDLLSAALDSGGWICIFVQKGDRQFNRFFKPGCVDEAVRYAEQQDKRGFNCYFCTATLQDSSNRETANRKANSAHAIKLLKLDLDIDPDKENKYASRDDAIAGLKQFCTEVGMPKPTVVSSGGGFHAYWFLSEAFDVEYGKSLQEQFKSLTIHYGLKADPTITADIVRVLRLPGTHNHKDPANPRLVELLTPVRVHDADTLADLIEEKAAKVPGAVPARLFDGADISHLQTGADAATKAIAGEDNFHYLFSKLLRLSLQDKGCMQVKRLWDTREFADENDWRDMLGLAKFADDGAEAIHLVSEKHEAYSYSETEKKALLVPKPFLCQHFIQGPHRELCNTCTHKDKIRTPIIIGRFVPRATEQDNVIISRNVNVDDKPRAYQIPEFPKGYYRGKYGGVYRESSEEDKPDTLICEKDFYAVANLKEQDETFLIDLCVNNGTDGVQQFVLPLEEIYGEGFKKTLSGRAITAPEYSKDGHRALQNYVIKFHELIRRQKPAVPVKHQFGWTEGFKSFVIGEREIRLNKDGSIAVEYSQPSPALVPTMTGKFRKSGTLEAWTKTIDAYNLYPQMAPHRFGVLVGFAAALMPFLDEDGAVLNFFAQNSGHGKSTVLRAQATMWGAPESMLNYKDTENSRYLVMGIYKNMPVVVDEMTDVPADKFKDFLFSVTQGRGKERMNAQTNTLRSNTTSWETLVSVSSNTCYAQAMRAAKTGNEGEMMRLIEIPFTDDQRGLISKTEADRLFGAMKTNFGHAGQAFIEHVMKVGVDHVRILLQNAQRDFDAEVVMDQKERFWSCVCAAVYVGGKLAQEIGLHRYDMQEMWDWMKELILNLRNTQKVDLTAEEIDTALMDFLGENTGGTVFTYGEGKRRWAREMPTSAIVARIHEDKDTGRVEVFILRRAFNKYLSDRNIHAAEFMKVMGQRGHPLREQTARLVLVTMEGTGGHGLSQKVYHTVLNKGNGGDDDGNSID